MQLSWLWIVGLLGAILFSVGACILNGKRKYPWISTRQFPWTVWICAAIASWLGITLLLCWYH
jgi:hypothetical protein